MCSTPSDTLRTELSEEDAKYQAECVCVINEMENAVAACRAGNAYNNLPLVRPVTLVTLDRRPGLSVLVRLRVSRLNGKMHALSSPRANVRKSDVAETCQ